ncbi:MAG TPA: RdgB/HAM1 family non-canonical purine NTP pyrophosphatase [Bacteroidota bacterium]|nr:RdgB/HAM1 family non-canonical purine NTP pyrophosphatase [Bacteroidota bacterium]
MKKLVVATHNRDKTREFSELLSDLGVEVLTLDAFPTVGQIVEDAPTLEGNALLKANAVHRASGLPSLADDTGLEVYYLNGEPGVFSSRYSGVGATYAQNVAKLLTRMRGVPPRRRAARFRCVLAFASASGSPVTVEGICPGQITERARGVNGFGYDPIFLPDGQHLTLAQMDIVLKNTLSHRALAMQQIKPFLRGFFK